MFHKCLGKIVVLLFFFVFVFFCFLFLRKCNLGGDMPNRHLATCFLRFSLISNDWQLLGLLSFIYIYVLSFLFTSAFSHPTFSSPFCFHHTPSLPFSVNSYPGGAILPVFDTLYQSEEFNFTLPRHEQVGTASSSTHNRCVFF